MIKLNTKIWLVVCLVICMASSGITYGGPLPIPAADQSSDIFGKYTVIKIGSAVLTQKIDVQISSSQIRFNGCNTNWASFSYDKTTKNFKVGLFASTRIACFNGDQDSLVSNAIVGSVRVYKRSNGLIIFQDSKKTETLRLNSKLQGSAPSNSGYIPPVPVVPTPLPVDQSADIFNKYRIFRIASVVLNSEYQLEINQNQIRIKGCNNLWGSFKYNPVTKFYTVSNFASTLIYCQGDQDSIVSKTISSSVRVYKRSDGFVIFEDSQGTQTLKLVVFVDNSYQPPVVVDESSDIFNTYKIDNLVSVNLNSAYEIQISQKQIRIKGCNRLSSKFTYNRDTKAFTVDKNFISTLIFCQGDQDYLIVKAIQSASRVFKRSNGNVIFQDTQGAQVMRLVSKPSDSNNGYIPTPTPVPAPSVDPKWPYINPPVIAPPVYLPGVSSFSLQGTYFFKASSSELSTLVVTFDSEYIQFQGCNVKRIPYAAYTDGVFVILRGGSSTRRQCIVDNDQAYLSLFSQANRFVKSNNGYTLYDRDLNIVNLQNKVRNQVVKYNVINGGYQLQVQGLNAYVSPYIISFTGCNSISIQYNLINNWDISFGPALSTLKFCDSDNDQIFTKAITKGRRLKKTSQGFSLVDAYGAETIKFLAYDRQYESDYKYFSGQFKLVLPNGGIRLKVSDGVFTLQGCNTFNFKFTLSDNGNIVFSNPTATTVACDSDYDSVFLNTILKAQSIAVVDKNIIFFSANNIQIAKAVNFDGNSSNGNNDKVVVVDPKSPVVPTVQYFLVQGTYKFTYMRSSLKVLSVTVSKDGISWRGCNIFNMKYIASSDGTIKFYPGPSTKIACKEDYDNLYVEALLSIVKFNEMKGMYTFFDNKGKSVVSFVLDIGAGVNLAPSIPSVPTTLPVDPIPSNPFKQVIEKIISLKGRYRFHLPKVGFQIINQDFVFKGCNTYRIPCTYKGSNIFFGNPISTNNNKCQGSDSIFLNLIPKILNFKKQNNIFTFFSALSKPLFSASVAGDRKFDAIPGLNAGSYQAQAPTADVDFDDNNLSFSSCSNSFGYKAKNTGSINFNGGNQSCNIDNYDAFSGAINNSVKYRNIDNGFVLEDKNGNQQGRCLLK